MRATRILAAIHLAGERAAAVARLLLAGHRRIARRHAVVERLRRAGAGVPELLAARRHFRVLSRGRSPLPGASARRFAICWPSARPSLLILLLYCTAVALGRLQPPAGFQHRLLADAEVPQAGQANSVSAQSFKR